MSRSGSIVLEWEQSRHQAETRSLNVLRRLGEEVRWQTGGVLSTPVELILCVDQSDLESARNLVLGTLGQDAELFEVRWVATGNLDYYAVKNLGAREATGQLIIFLDSDVVPEPGWLAKLLAPFEDPDVQVVGGNTYVELGGIRSRAFALTWSFPLRSTTDETGPMASLRANNLAFRRETAERFPFPSMPEASRRACQVLKWSMIRAGVTMVTAHGARVSHPAPTPPGQFLSRALSQGRDRVLYATPGWERTWRGTRRRFWLDLIYTLRRLLGGRRQAGLTPAALPLATATSVSFVLCCAIGELLTLADRDFMVRHFRV